MLIDNLFQDELNKITMEGTKHELIFLKDFKPNTIQTIIFYTSSIFNYITKFDTKSAIQGRIVKVKTQSYCSLVTNKNYYFIFPKKTFLNQISKHYNVFKQNEKVKVLMKITGKGKFEFLKIEKNEVN